MSDINPGAGIDSALDSAFAAIGEATEPAALGEGKQQVLPPNAISDEGIWNHDREQKERAKAERAAKSKDGKDDKVDAKDGKHDRDKGHAADNRKENRKSQLSGLDAALDKAFKDAPKAAGKRKDDRDAEAKGEKPKPLSTKEFSSTREHRRSIKSLFPGEKLSQVLTIAEKWDGLLRENPTMETVEKLAAEILKLPRTAKGKEQAEAGEGRTKALDRGAEDAADHEDITAFVEKYGDRLPSILERLTVWLPEIKEDPYGAGARLLASMGAIDPPQAAQQQTKQEQRQPISVNGFVPGSRPPATPEEHTACLLQGIDNHANGSMPGLKDDDIAFAVAEVLARMPRTGNPDADLQTAYRLVVAEAPAAAKEPVKDAKGGKSISGAPASPSVPRRAKGGAKGLDDALNRAFGGM